MKHTGLLAAAQIWNKLFQINGLDDRQIWQEVGALPVLQDDPNARVPIHYLDAAVMLAASRIADPGWCLKMAQCWHPGNLGVLGHAWLASSTLRTSLTGLPATGGSSPPGQKPQSRTRPKVCVSEKKRNLNPCR